jgi:hypothetical protein
MKRRLPALAAATLAVAVLSGCGLLDADAGRPVAADAAGPKPADAAGPKPADAAEPKPADAKPAESGVSGLGAAAPADDELPDPCSLLSRADVVSLTGRAITEVDGDDAKPGDDARYCQWQQDGGQLALFLAKTTADGFETGVSQAEPVDGVEGYDAYELAGHLYVLDDEDVQVDVYSHGGTDEENLAEEIRVVKVVLPRLAN